MLTLIARYVRRKWWFLLLVAVLLALNAWVWRLALMPAPQPLAPTTAAHEARAPLWLSWVILAVYVPAWFYVVGKGWPILLRELGWERDDEHWPCACGPLRATGFVLRPLSPPKLMFNYYYKRIAAVLGAPDKGGPLRWFRQDVLRLPIRVPDRSVRKDVALRDKLIALGRTMLKLSKRLLAPGFNPERAAIERQIVDTDKQIDQLVYELYGLTEEEIGIVEGGAK